MDTTNTTPTPTVNSNLTAANGLEPVRSNVLREQFPNVTNFEELLEEINSTDQEGTPKYSLGVKQNDDLCLIYYEDKGGDVDVDPVSSRFKSYIFEKSTLKPIGSQLNRIIYNEEALEYLNQIGADRWNQVKVHDSYEGTTIMVFYHGDKWYVSTRRCLNSDKSNWVKNLSYRQMFDEAAEGKFTLDGDLNKDYCYHFILLHHLNKNIISYGHQFGQGYKVLVHTMTTTTTTAQDSGYFLEEVPLDQSRVPNVDSIKEVSFNCLDDLLSNLKTVNDTNKKNHQVTTEGYVLQVDGVTLKLQTELYQTIVKIKPNNSNINQSYLELFQTDRLPEYIRYFTQYNSEVVKRISICMKTVSKELLNLYHSTRQKKNQPLYNLLGGQYKKVLYKLHGVYISYRKQAFSGVNGGEDVDSPNQDINQDPNQDPNMGMNPLSRSVNVHDVYHTLKGLPPTELRQLFRERMDLINKDPNMTQFLDRGCVYTKAQCELMF